MKNHKRILLSLVFMLLFVQSTLYFSGSQLLLGDPEGKRTVCSSQERKKVPSVTVPMSAKDTRALCTREKQVSIHLTDFSQCTSYTEECPEEKSYRWRDESYLERQEKQKLPDGLRAPPETNHVTLKAI